MCRGRGQGIPGCEKPLRGGIMAGAPLAMGGTAGGATEEMRGGDTPTPGRGAKGTGGTPGRPGNPGIPAGQTQNSILTTNKHTHLHKHTYTCAHTHWHKGAGHRLGSLTEGRGRGQGEGGLLHGGRQRGGQGVTLQLQLDQLHGDRELVGVHLTIIIQIS